MKTKNFLRWVGLGVLVSLLVSKMLSSEKGKKAQKDLQDLAKKISLEIADEAEGLGVKLNKEKYNQLVEQVVAKYLKGIKIAKRTKENLLKELKRGWEKIKK